jgi:hypothetical protein
MDTLLFTRHCCTIDSNKNAVVLFQCLFQPPTVGAKGVIVKEYLAEALAIRAKSNSVNAKWLGACHVSWAVYNLCSKLPRAKWG